MTLWLHSVLTVLIKRCCVSAISQKCSCEKEELHFSHSAGICDVPGSALGTEGTVWVMKFKSVFFSPFVDPGFLVGEGQEIIVPANREGF